VQLVERIEMLVATKREKTSAWRDLPDDKKGR
jgi:hypothetical protein